MIALTLSFKRGDAMSNYACVSEMLTTIESNSSQFC
jgi:hypothetical protein